MGNDANRLLKTSFHIQHMDCPAEEQLIRMKVEGMSGLHHLSFDLANRRLDIYHRGQIDAIADAIRSLSLGDKLIGTTEADESLKTEDHQQRRLLWAVLLINVAFFLVEMITGWIARSMGLIADSLDMLADALVYGMSLFAVGATVVRKKQVARLAGYFQVTLALLGFGEVARRFITAAALPDPALMIGISIFALIANAVSLHLLNRSRSQDAHIRASMIFTSNDVIINAGVILAGGLVIWTESRIPDLVIGAIVFLLVLRGARNILQLAR